MNEGVNWNSAQVETAFEKANPQMLELLRESVEQERERHRIMSAPPPRLVRLSTVKTRPVEWLWTGYLTLWECETAVGKTTAILDVLARVTTTGVMPDGSRGQTGNVVILAAEDGLSDMLAPRLIAAGAETENVDAFTSVAEGDDDAGEWIDLSKHLPTLERAIFESEAIAVLIDPINGFLPSSIDPHKDASIRRVLAPLANLAERHGVAIIAVRHWKKGAGGSALDRGIGSVGYNAAARSVLCCGYDPEDPEKQRRVLASVKTNLGVRPSSLSYSIRSAEIEGIETSGIEWHGSSTYSADDIAGLQDEKARKPTAVDRARAAILEALENGPIRANDLETAVVEGLGIGRNSFEKARSELRDEKEIVRDSVGMPAVVWWRTVNQAPPPE